jgi:hypothetical protein
MAHYVNVTHEEMGPFLTLRHGFQRMNIESVQELVYGKIYYREGTPISMRIYTGIDATGNSRSKGQDAIRLCLFVRDNEGQPKMIGVAKRVHRVKGWRKNLEDRLNNWQELLGPICPVCSNFMILRSQRKNRKSKFWGCSNFPSCVATKPFQG